MRRIITVVLYLLWPFFTDAQKACSYTEYDNYLQTTHPGLTERYASLAQTLLNRQQATSSSNLFGVAAPVDAAVPDQIVIPVVIHIITPNGGKVVTDDQVRAQLEALNRDFNARNTDLANVPAHFAGLVANAGIRFELAKFDPKGKATTGIIRKQTSIQNFVMDDRVKFSARGGDDAWDSDQYLNIWVCTLLNSIQGYSSKPGAPKEVDGVVLNQSVFGQLDSLNRYHMGRVAVHEIGHWLGLKHIWGDGYCGDDGIGDTPPQKTYNKGCPSGQIFSCGTSANGDMYMNYMDMTDDACMYMFTIGQRAHMRSLFEKGGVRHSILAGSGLNGKGQQDNVDNPYPEIPVVRTLSLYPVPSQGQLTISITDGSFVPGRKVLVYNSLGQVAFSFLLNSPQQQVNISSLRTGAYYIQVEGGAYKAARFMKM